MDWARADGSYREDEYSSIDVGLPSGARASETPVADRRRADRAQGGRVGAGLRSRPSRRTRQRHAFALARRVALLPADQLHMMKLLVNQAYEQMGLHVTQLIGTLLDGIARHTPEGTAFTQHALQDVRQAVADRDRPFADYGQTQRTGPEKQ
jgi:enoyl-CoA hydratase/carnithine racemase